jgi:uncharacterized ferritin-like protein (DUF455 family)
MSSETKRHEAVEKARLREIDIHYCPLPEGDVREWNMEQADENRKSAWERARKFLEARGPDAWSGVRKFLEVRNSE